MQSRVGIADLKRAEERKVIYIGKVIYMNLYKNKSPSRCQSFDTGFGNRETRDGGERPQRAEP